MCESVVCVSECMKVWERSRLWPALAKAESPSLESHGVRGGGRSYTPGNEGLKACGICVTGLSPSPDLALQAVGCKLEPLLLRRTIG